MTEITPDEPDWHDWPDLNQLQRLSDRANGLFHYAATALHWIERRIVEDGTACRESVFKEFSEGGLNELEDLYRLILTSWENVGTPSKDKDRRATRLDGFQHVIGTIIVLQKPLLVCEIIALLSDIPKDKFDVTNFLRQMRSVLIPGTTTSFDHATPQMHKSFRDYITSGRAPLGFRILTGDAHFKVARSCLDNIVKAGSQGDNGNEYAVFYWHKHLREAGVRCDDKMMWKLLGEMVNERVVGVWIRKGYWANMFRSVANTGWKLLKQKTDEQKLVLMSEMLVKIKLELRELREETTLCLLISRRQTIVCAFFLLFITTNIPSFWMKPYAKIWVHGLLETWKHYEPVVLHPNIVEMHAELNYQYIVQ
ncbi:uncharacterized protein LACBIDRAFT_334538 [Laccaria bicolor S238N-H82]|uniref:Predicted protein n=1 Tax=Laccaria bicolor (strain S238N-H82 / ATCC MYA-4686) TaxID=486041 RepID=B0DZG6_LACBS|nr:uncharacterized protein LACBIDRAFT_334538 [Laccaria bicolor S238N-H82]EDR00015.1 predicted protein [Laccaria bicolor S238N-H82]|eukprot:XP_001889324.1 predicted protein [Laccaria bicolor S238N-H82]